MKKYLLFIAILLFINSISFATTRIITVQNFSFSPSSLNAFVGDSIKWVWVSGTHTTTSTTIPLSATPWDSPLSSLTPTYIYVITTTGLFSYKCTPHELMGMTGTINVQTSSVSQIGTTVTSYELKQNYPNPFNPTTNINFSIPKSGLVKISVYNILGSEVKSLVNENLNAGTYNVKFDAALLTSGIYFYKISAGDFNSIKRMILLK